MYLFSIFIRRAERKLGKAMGISKAMLHNGIQIRFILNYFFE